MRLFTITVCMLLPIGLLAGCAPLEQAPLVYSSKQTLGIDLSTATTEQPGLALNLGFKSVDAAYVPVAVAKKCEATASNSKDCSLPIYEVRQIKGYHNLSDTSGSKEKLEEAQKIINAFTSATNSRKAADTALQQANTQRAEAMKSVEKSKAQATSNAEQREKDGKASAPVAQGGAAPPVATEADTRAAETKAEAQRSELAAKAASANAELAKADINVRAKEGELETAKTDLEKIPLSTLADALKIVVTATNGKEDAYSVFGSFSTNTAVGSNNTAPDGTKGTTVAATAGVSLGKVFSTGVASQNLTLGIREYYAGAAIASSQGAYTECMKSVRETYKRIGIPANEAKVQPAEKDELLAAYKACQYGGLSPVAKQ